VEKKNGRERDRRGRRTEKKDRRERKGSGAVGTERAAGGAWRQARERVVLRGLWGRVERLARRDRRRAESGIPTW
jgi:hypothetical protein